MVMTERLDRPLTAGTLAAKLILAGNVGREDTILIDVKDGKLTADVKGRIVSAE